MSEYFAFLSGETTDLGRAELSTLAELLDFQVRIKWSGRLAQIEATDNPVPFLLDRAALVKEAGSVIATSHKSHPELGDIPDSVLQGCATSSESFVVRTISLSNHRRLEFRNQMVKSLGRRIRNLTKARVSAKNPDVKILTLVLDDKILVCKSTESRLRKDIRAREPGKKTFFHPSMMNASLSRIMCNLANVMPEDIVVDPFCGGGGILCEVASIGAIPVGIDLNWRLLRGAQTNLTSDFTPGFNLIQGDARHLPLEDQSCNAIVTDPPYGRASSTRGSLAKDLVEKSLKMATNLLVTNGRLCICGSSDMDIPEIVRHAGFNLIHKLRVPVHSGLIREIVSATI
ncbi:MAG: methyltransferase [Candidatus Thorarchaeota archaeon]